MPASVWIDRSAIGAISAFSVVEYGVESKANMLASKIS
jgi:hypothetical protein